MDRETKKSIAFLGFVIAAAYFVFGACLEGGANSHEQSSGNNDQGGIDFGVDPNPADGLSYGAIAISPDGSYFLSRVGTELVKGDLASGAVTAIATVDDEPDRVVFAEDGSRFYVSSSQGGWLKAINSKSLFVLWTISIDHLGDVRVYNSPDDQHLVLAGDHEFEVWSAENGTFEHRHITIDEHVIVDVDITPDSQTVLVTPQHTWNEANDTPQTLLQKVSLTDGTSTTIDVPNCASPLVLTPDGSKAFMAPTMCNRDPISVIDVGAGTHLRNLPGFGPVAMASDGVTAIGFMDARAVDETLFLPQDPRPAPDAAYFLMLINAETLAFDIVDVGEQLPRYTIAPNGKVVLVDDGMLYSESSEELPESNVRILDVDKLCIHDVEGPVVRFNHFALSPNSMSVYLLFRSAFFHLDIPERRVSERALPFDGEPTALNITPDGKRLLLRDDAEQIHLYDIATAKILLTIPRPTRRFEP